MRFKLVKDLNETQERTVYNALASWENYASKYSKSDALFELRANFHLTDEETAWILKKLVKKGLVDESDFDWNIKYLKLEDQFPDRDEYFPEEEIHIDELCKLYEGINPLPRSEEPYPLNQLWVDRDKIKYNKYVLDVDWHTADVPILDLISNQYYVDDGKVDELVEDPAVAALPPIVVKYDNKYFVLDGNHRVAANIKNGRDSIGCVVYKFEDVEEAYYNKLNELEGKQLTEGYLDDEEEFYDYGTEEVIDKDIFDVNKGESPYAKEMIKLSKTGGTNEKGLGAEIIQMTPKEYFEDMARGFNSTFDKQIKQIEYDKRVLDHLKQVITKYKRKFPITYINVDSKYGNFEQEGRHRMYVAGELFGWDTKFPVMKIFEKDKEKADKIRLEKKKERYSKVLRTALRKAEPYSYKDLDELKQQVDYELESEFSYQDDPSYTFDVRDRGDNIDFTLNDLITITRDKKDFNIDPNNTGPEDIDDYDLDEEEINQLEKELGLKFGESLITEGRDAYFYHGTSWYNFINILKDNELRLRTGAVSISFARDIKVAENYGDVVLVLDQNKLAQNYKIVPVSDWVRNYKNSKPDKPGRKLGNNKTEEQIYKNIKPLNKYLVKIMIKLFSQETVDGYKWLLDEYSKKYNIPIEVEIKEL